MKPEDIIHQQLQQLSMQNPELAKQIAGRYGLPNPISHPLPRDSNTQFQPQVNQAPPNMSVPTTGSSLSLFTWFNDLILDPLGHEDYSRAQRLINNIYIGNDGDMAETASVIKSSFMKFLKTEDGKDIVRMAVSGFLRDFENSTSGQPNPQQNQTSD